MLFWICKVDFAIFVLMVYEQVCISMKLYIKAVCDENTSASVQMKTLSLGFCQISEAFPEFLRLLPLFKQPKHGIKMSTDNLIELYG